MSPFERTSHESFSEKVKNICNATVRRYVSSLNLSSFYIVDTAVYFISMMLIKSLLYLDRVAFHENQVALVSLQHCRICF
jgi:hypothetical protein